MEYSRAYCKTHRLGRIWNFNQEMDRNSRKGSTPVSRKCIPVKGSFNIWPTKITILVKYIKVKFGYPDAKLNRSKYISTQERNTSGRNANNINMQSPRGWYWRRALRAGPGAGCCRCCPRSWGWSSGGSSAAPPCSAPKRLHWNKNCSESDRRSMSAKLIKRTNGKSSMIKRSFQPKSRLKVYPLKTSLSKDRGHKVKQFSSFTRKNVVP